MAPPHAPRKRWIVVLVAALVSIFGIAIAGTALFMTNTWPPLEAASDFANDLEDGDLEGAYAQMCDAFKETVGREEFDLFASSLLAEAISIEVDPFGVDRDGDRATVDLTVHQRGGRSDDFGILVFNVDRGWRPCFSM